MSDIKILVSCHRKYPVPPHPILFPMQVGAALNTERFEGFFQDDVGENISHKNRCYCELTAQYWAWKNLDADYYGFFHYRRYLYPNLKNRLPYRLEGAVSAKLLEKLRFDEISGLIEKHDLVCPKAEDMHQSVREHYAGAKHHIADDIELVERILKERHPEMRTAAETYFSGSKQYFGNIYIMKKWLFYDYCQWLFPILEEFERQCDMSDRSAQEIRAPGYLAERLFGVYLEYHRKKISCLELPRVHFESEFSSLLMSRIVNTMLPPGSQIRAAIKKKMRGQEE